MVAITAAEIAYGVKKIVRNNPLTFFGMEFTSKANANPTKTNAGTE